MSDWIRTRAGLQMAEAIARYLPRITVCLEELAKNKQSVKHCDECGYYEDIIASHYEECSKLEEKNEINTTN